MNISIHTDGGSRGNPGPAAIGVVIEQGNQTIAEFGKKIGETTNNVAEYTAVIEALSYIDTHAMLCEEICFYLDSLLVVNQIKRLYKVKEIHLQSLMQKIRDLEQRLQKKITYTYIPREQNREADKMVNLALDTP